MPVALLRDWDTWTWGLGELVGTVLFYLSYLKKIIIAEGRKFFERIFQSCSIYTVFLKEN